MIGGFEFRFGSKPLGLAYGVQTLAFRFWGLQLSLKRNAHQSFEH